MDKDLNYFGATIFWLYIVAALFFSAIVITTIANIKPPNSVGTGRRDGDWKMFATLAAISFSTLSFNMLSVLIQSYISWSKQNDLQPRLDVSQIWTWSIHSRLFQDFGEAIVASTGRYLWAESALLATLSISLYMGIEGQPKALIAKGGVQN